MSTKFSVDAEGVLSQLGELHALRASQLRSSDPDANGAGAAFGRLTEDEESQLVEAVLRRTLGPPALERRSGTVTHPSPGSRREPLPQGFRRAWGFAAAAALILVGGMLYGTRLTPSRPEYVLVSPASDAQFRGDSSGVSSEPHAPERAYRIGRELRFVVRPQHPFAETPSVRVFAGSNGTEALSAVRLEPLEGGSIRVSLKTGPGGYMPRPGRDRLLIVLGERSAWRSLLHAFSAPDGGVVQSFELPVTWHRVSE